MLFGLACCTIGLMHTGGPRAELILRKRAASGLRQSDLMIVARTLIYKMAKRTKLLYEGVS
jgi:NADH:ubiquinone oxidoreductase subunit B-like Fe-S oxidoreductase